MNIPKCEKCYSEFNIGVNARINDMPGDQGLRLNALLLHGKASQDKIRKIKEEPHFVYFSDCQTLSPNDEKWLGFILQ